MKKVTLILFTVFITVLSCAQPINNLLRDSLPVFKWNDIVTGPEFELTSIGYDFDQSLIRPDAERILDNVAMIMVQNPSFTILLSAHADSRGNYNYNQLLSEKRVLAAADYLVRQGIDRNRLIAKGYGKKLLLNSCLNTIKCTDEAHQENRRTEIKVVRYFVE